MTLYTSSGAQGAACLGLLSEAGNAGWSGVLEDACSLHYQQAIQIEAACWHLHALSEAHWKSLSTDVGPADLRCAVHHFAIQGHLQMAPQCVVIQALLRIVWRHCHDVACRSHVTNNTVATGCAGIHVSGNIVAT